MTETIAFFGASVTGQKEGYAWHLSKKLNTPYVCFPYGGNHLHDAGICFIDDVLQENLNYCFIDFFSTDYTTISDITLTYIDTIIYKFTNVNVKLIFLFLLKDDTSTRLPFYNFIKDYLHSKNIYYIDINEYIEFSSEYIRDNLHTTPAGSVKYADIIYDKFQKDKHAIILPKDITKTKYVDSIKVLNLNLIVHDTIKFEGDCVIIGFYINVGPKSGIVKVNGRSYNCWDKHCHYIRSSFKLQNVLVKGRITLDVSQEPIDYSSCRRDYDFTNIIKELNIIKIFYIGTLRHLINDCV
jgi:hypothetical protein